MISPYTVWPPIFGNLFVARLEFRAKYGGSSRETPLISVVRWLILPNPTTHGEFGVLLLSLVISKKTLPFAWARGYCLAWTTNPVVAVDVTTPFAWVNPPLLLILTSVQTAVAVPFLTIALPWVAVHLNPSNSLVVLSTFVSTLILVGTTAFTRDGWKATALKPLAISVVRSATLRSALPPSLNRLPAPIAPEKGIWVLFSIVGHRAVPTGTPK